MKDRALPLLVDVELLRGEEGEKGKRSDPDALVMFCHTADTSQPGRVHKKSCGAGLGICTLCECECV